jgi:hypothetical protein
MEKTSPTENTDVVTLSSLLADPRCSPALRDVVLLMTERRDDLTLDYVLEALSIDAQALIEQLVASAIGAEALRLVELDARRGLN